MKELFFESIDSTNTYLKRNYEDLEDLTFVRADLQTAGKGRNTRKWSSSKGKNLMFSLLVKDKKVMKAFGSLSVLSAYAVLKVLESYGIEGLSIKWPNDVYVKGKKICGILLEGVSKDEMECLIIGIGINVNEDRFEGDFLHEPVSMKQILNKDVDLEKFKEKIYDLLIETIDSIRSGTDLYEKVIAYDYLKGKRAYCLIDGLRKEVSIIGIDADYSLKISDEGEEKNIFSDEITFHL